LNASLRSYVHSCSDKETFLQCLSVLLEAHDEILFAYAHGSFIEEGPFRDLDVAVYMKPEVLPPSKFFYEDHLAREIANSLNPPFPIDIRLLNGTPISFQYHVFQGYLLLDREPDQRLDLVTYVIARYLDMKPILRHYLKEAHSREAQP